jgi:6,7-dimethyl-8-ribityllumazine synthase
VRSGRGRRFAIVASRFHEDITRRLVAGATAALRGHGVAQRDVVVHWVPGAFELAQAAQWLAERGGVDGVVCVGCVIRGETPHFEYVARESARGVAEVARRTGVPTTFGVITADTRQQATARAGGPVGNRGAEAALAALEMAELLAALRRPGSTRVPGHRRARGGRA